MQTTILPGKTIGILGGGQLGRMLCIAARAMGYRTEIYCPLGQGPASQAADGWTARPWDDEDSLRKWLTQVDVVTVEFENVPATCMQLAESLRPARPGANVLRVAQHRLREKQTLADAGLPVTPFASVTNWDDLVTAGEQLGWPLVLKTATSGYDGKGQAVVRDATSGAEIISQLVAAEFIAEKWIQFDREVSVLVARGVDGQLTVYPAIENTHRHHILDLSICPARDADRLQRQIIPIARTVAESLDLVGLLCIEFFVTGAGEVMINEIAPRPHNSGHLTLEAFGCDQFQQTIRAVCGIPLAEPVLLRSAAMVNLLGDLWNSQEPNWQAALHVPETSLHLYGKPTPRPGRKMGHLTALGESSSEAASRAIEARNLLTHCD